MTAYGPVLASVPAVITPRAVLAALTAVAVSACSTTATIHTSRSVFEGDIVESDASHVLVRTASGRDVRIRRSEIAEVDHPGNVHLLLGVLLAGYGIANVGVGLGDCTSGTGSARDNPGAFCVGLFTPLVVGAAMSIFGGILWGTSKANYRPREGVVVRPRVASERPSEIAPPPAVRLPAGLYDRPEVRPACADCERPRAAAIGGVFSNARDAAVARDAFASADGSGYPFLAHTDELGTRTSTGVAVVLGLFAEPGDADRFAREHRARVMTLLEPSGRRRVVELTSPAPVVALRWGDGTVTATAACTLAPKSAYVLDRPPEGPLDWIDAPCDGDRAVIDIQATRFNAVGVGRRRLDQVTAGGVINRRSDRRLRAPRRLFTAPQE